MSARSIRSATRKLRIPCFYSCSKSLRNPAEYSFVRISYIAASLQCMSTSSWKMGSYTFQWPHPANEVFVTGSFDDWGKTVKLDRSGDVFTKEVQLPSADDKVHYKVGSALRSFPPPSFTAVPYFNYIECLSI